jgi:sensor histidine kinase regulating citrate/malate metabolism
MPDKTQNKVQNVILDSISEGVFTIDLDWRITSFNLAAELNKKAGRKQPAMCDLAK